MAARKVGYRTDRPVGAFVFSATLDCLTCGHVKTAHSDAGCLVALPISRWATPGHCWCKLPLGKPGRSEVQ